MDARGIGHVSSTISLDAERRIDALQASGGADDLSTATPALSGESSSRAAGPK